MGIESVIKAATDTFGKGGYQYILGGKGTDANRDGLKEVDCSFLVGTALKQAGVVTGVAVNNFSTATLFKGDVLTSLATERFDAIKANQVLAPNALQPGDLILWKATNGSGQHIGIFDHYDAQNKPVFFGSQSSSGPAFAKMGGSTADDRTGGTWTGKDFTIVGALRAKPDFYVPEFDQTGAPETGIATPRVAALVNLLKTEGAEGYRPGIYSGDGKGKGDGVPTFGNGFALAVADGKGVFSVLPEADIKASFKLAGIPESRYDELPLDRLQKNVDFLNQGNKSNAIAAFGDGKNPTAGQFSVTPVEADKLTAAYIVRNVIPQMARGLDGVDMMNATSDGEFVAIGSRLYQQPTWLIKNPDFVDAWLNDDKADATRLIVLGHAGKREELEAAAYGGNINPINDNLGVTSSGESSNSHVAVSSAGGYWDDQTAYDLMTGLPIGGINKVWIPDKPTTTSTSGTATPSVAPTPANQNTSEATTLSQDGKSATLPNGQVISAGTGGRLDLDATGKLTVTRSAKGYEDQSAQDGPVFNITQYSKNGQVQSSAQVQIVYDPKYPGGVSHSTALVQGQTRDIVQTNEDGTTSTIKVVFQVGAGWVEPGTGELVQGIKAWAESPSLGSAAQPLPFNYLPATFTTPSPPINYPEGAGDKDYVNEFDLQSDQYVPPNSAGATAPASNALYQALINAFQNTQPVAGTNIGTQYADAGNTTGNGNNTAPDAGGGGTNSVPTTTSIPPDQTYTNYLSTTGVALSAAQQDALANQLQSLNIGGADTLSFITLPGGSTLIANLDGDIIGEINLQANGYSRLSDIAGNNQYAAPNGQSLDAQQYNANQQSQINTGLGLAQSVIALQNWQHMTDLQRLSSAVGIYNQISSLNDLSQGLAGGLPDINGVGGEPSGMGVLGAGLNFLSALDTGNPLGILQSGLSLSAQALQYQSSILTSQSNLAAQSYDAFGAASLSAEASQASQLAGSLGAAASVVGLVMALESGNVFSIASSMVSTVMAFQSLMGVASSFGPYGMAIAIGLSIFGSLFGGDEKPDIPMQEGIAHAQWDAAGNTVVVTDQDNHGGGATAQAWMSSLVNGLQTQLASTYDGNGNSYVLVPNLLPAIGFQYDQDGFNLANGARGFMVLRWIDEQGQPQTRYYDGAGSRGDGAGQTLASDFMQHAQQAIAPAWQVDTALAHYQQGQGISLPKAAQGLPQSVGDGIHQAMQAITLALPVEPLLQSAVVDIDGDGYLEQSQWLANNQTALAIDANGNGKIDAGELIKLNGPGLNALSWLDANGDGKLTASDPAFSALRLWIDINGDANSQGETSTLAQAGIVAIDFTSNPPQIIKADGSTTQLTVQTLTGNILGTQYQNVTGGVLQLDERRNTDGSLAAPDALLHAINTRQFDGQAAHISGGVAAATTAGTSNATIAAGDARLSTTTARTINNQSAQSSTTVNAGDARLQNAAPTSNAQTAQAVQAAQITQAAQIRNSSVNALAFIPLGGSNTSPAQEQRQVTEAMIRSADSGLFGMSGVGGGGVLPLAAVAIGAAAVQWPTVANAANTNNANNADTVAALSTGQLRNDSNSNNRLVNDSPVFVSSNISSANPDPIRDLSSTSSSPPTSQNTPNTAIQSQFEASNTLLAQQILAQAATESIANQINSSSSPNVTSNDSTGSNDNNNSSQTSQSNQTTFTTASGIQLAYPRVRGETANSQEDSVLRFVSTLLLANDSTDNAPSRLSEPALTITNVFAPTHGSVSLQTSGSGANEIVSIVFVPDANYHGTASFGYTVTDQYGLSSQATTTISIAAVNDAPVAVGEAATGDEDTSLYFTPASLLANDSDADTATDGQVLSISRVYGATHGTAGIGADGRIFFTPDQDYNGPASFSYTVSDGTGEVNGTSNAIVTLTVTPVNDAPVAVGETTNTLEDTQLVINPASLLANDSDVDDPQSSLTLSLTLSQVSNASHGTVALTSLTDAQGNPIACSQRIIFMPDANYHGPASFSYTVSDPHGASSTATASISIAAINDAPVAVGESATGDEDNTLQFTAATLLANDSDVDTPVDGDVLRITRVSSAQHGQVFLAPDGTVSFVPDANYNGPAQFSYWVGDRSPAQLASAGNGGDGFETQATVRLTILPVNDLPVVTGETLASDEDIVLNINPALLSANDTDVDTVTNGQVLSISAVSNPQHCSIVLLADGTLQFTPERDYFGAAGFSYTVNDGAGGLVTGQVVVNLAPINDAPVVVGETVTFNEDTIQTISQAALLANDSDVDNPHSDLRIIAVGNATHGMISLNPDGSIRFAPDADYFGPAQFTYTLSDGTAGANSFSIGTATLDITPVNDAPVAQGETLTLDEDNQARFSISSLLANDTDVDNLHSDLTITAVQIDPASAANGSVSIVSGQIVFTPTLNFNGQASFSYTVSDGVGGSSQTNVNLTFNPINDAPITNSELVYGKRNIGYTLTQAALLANDTDVETLNSLTISSISNVQHGSATLNSDGSVRFIPTTGFAGRGSFDYAVTDPDGASSIATAQIDFSRVNTIPIATDDSFVGFEDVAFSITAAQLLVNDSDADNAQSDLRMVAVSGATNGTVSLQSDGSVRFTGAANFYGTAGFNYQVSDGDGGLTWARAQLSLQSVNDAPIIEDIWGGRPVYGALLGAPYISGYDESGSPIYVQESTPITNEAYARALYASGQLSGASGTFYQNGQLRPAYLNYLDAFNSPYTEGGTFVDDPYRQNGRIVAYDLEGDAITYSVSSSPQHGHAWANLYTNLGAPDSIDHTQAGPYWIGETGAWQYYSQRGDGYTGVDYFTMRATDSGGAFVDQVIGATHTGSPVAGGGGGGKKPVTLDLDGNGLHYIGLDDSNAYFDVNNDGWREHLAWVSAGDAFLVLDKGTDKVIDRFDEISFTGYLSGARTDLEGLAAFDSNGDGLLSRLDKRWREFAVWQDVDGNGISTLAEVHTLNEMGIAQISLQSDHNLRQVDGVTEFGQALFTWADGQTGAVGDVALPVGTSVVNAGSSALQPVTVFAPKLTPEHMALLMVQMISTITAAQDMEPLAIVPMSNTPDPQHALLVTQAQWEHEAQL